MSSAIPPSPSGAHTTTNSHEVMVSRIIGGAILAAIGIYALVVGIAMALPIIIFTLPLIIGAVISLIASDELTDKTEAWGTSHDQRLDAARSATGTFARWFKRPLYGGFALLWRVTRPINYRHVRATLRVTGLLYFAGLMIYLLLMAVYIIVAFIIFGLIIWIVVKVAGWDNENEQVPTTSRLPILGGAGRSVQRDGFFGKYTEHINEDGEKVGESRERDGLFGKYTEHTNQDGEKVGESRERDGFFGQYTEHTDEDGEKMGESRERDGFMGKYTEHTNKDGEKVGESSDCDGLFGKYTEHTDE